MKRAEALAEISRICRFKHYSLNTEETYCHWTGRFFSWLAAHHDEVGPEPSQRMEGFLSDLARQDVAAATQNQAFSAILFFYRHVMKQEPGRVDSLRAKRPQFLRHAPPQADVVRLLNAVENTPIYPFKLIACMLYGCGLRVSEPLEIRIRDLDLGNKRVIIRQAKGAKDRMVPIPDCLIPAIQNQIQAARVVWQRAVSQGIPAKLPSQLGRKYRSAGSEFAWFWLFPMPSACTDPRGGQKVWWHCLPTGVQKALRKAGNSAGINGLIRPHDLRHAWATHAHDSGASVRDLQEILGHKSLETTMIYVHTEIERVSSPIEALKIAL
jgi:site-specific recombinase XerD